MRRIHLGWLLVPAAIVVGGVALFATRGTDTGSAFSLAVGDCFDLASDTAISDVNVQPCTAPHDGEVFAIEDVSTPSAWPGEQAFQTLVANDCVGSAFQPYVGASYGARQDLKVGYFFPPEAAWANGQRRLTCYVSTSDGTKLTASVRVKS